ncbi:MAG: hypothetical protein GYA57_20375 [Myxococcales bacterium]|nr:hypothetical protein [Myxococcales bacterium]
MKTSSVILWGAVGVLVALAFAVSCADSSSPACDLAECQNLCIASHHAGGECRDNSCFCTDTPPPADADADIPDIIDTPPDLPPPDVTEVVDDAVRPDDAAREEYAREEYVPREDYGSTGDGDGGGPSDVSGDYKSGCDPLICFMSCGGSCSPGGECVCAAP